MKSREKTRVVFDMVSSKQSDIPKLGQNPFFFARLDLNLWYNRLVERMHMFNSHRPLTHYSGVFFFKIVDKMVYFFATLT